MVKFGLKETEEQANDILEKIYYMYASAYGTLFGISPELKPAVKSIIKLTLEILQEKY